jgi:hypothetical protein
VVDERVAALLVKRDLHPAALRGGEVDRLGRRADLLAGVDVDRVVGVLLRVAVEGDDVRLRGGHRVHGSMS